MRCKAASMLVALTLSMALGGCASWVMIPIAGLTVASFGMTKKLPPDHVATWVTGEECSALQAERTGEYCRTEAEIAAAEQAAAPSQAPPVYCYRTLGEVDCRSEPDPSAEGRLVQ